jgi:hypothetical protein
LVLWYSDLFRILDFGIWSLEFFPRLCFVYYYVVCYNLDELKKTIL